MSHACCQFISFNWISAFYKLQHAAEPVWEPQSGQTPSLPVVNVMQCPLAAAMRPPLRICRSSAGKHLAILRHKVGRCRLATAFISLRFVILFCLISWTTAATICLHTIFGIFCQLIARTIFNAAMIDRGWRGGRAEARYSQELAFLTPRQWSFRLGRLSCSRRRIESFQFALDLDFSLFRRLGVVRPFGFATR